MEQRQKGPLRFAYINGGDTGERRSRVLEAIKQGQLDIVITSVIWDEGIDAPNLSALILAGGGKAPHKMIQRIGRGQRRAVGKDRLFVIDFADQGRYLGRHASKRRALYEKEPAYSLDVLTKAEAEELLGEEEQCTSA